MGREGELALIRDALESGSGVVLAGAPGVGKTRLAYEAVTMADPRRYLSLWAAATPATTPIPLGALSPLLPAELPTSPAALLRCATEALLDRCDTRGLVLGIDDAHLLDEISATLVYQLARTGRVLVLASLRSRHAVPGPIRALWKDALVSRVEVDALSPEGTTQVLAVALGGQVDGVTSRRLCRAARGNLLFLRELVTAGIESGALTEMAGVWRWEGPWVTTPRLVELISDRIGRLDRAEQDVLEIVAYGEPIGADLLISLAGQRTVEAAESRNLLWASRDRRRVDVRLAHPLYGEVLRAGCPPERAAAVRRALADAVEATGARRNDDWLRIVTWRLDADATLGPELLAAAAGRAFAMLDLPLAERLARAAFDAGTNRSARPAASAVLWRVLFLSRRSTETEEVLARLDGAAMSDSQRADYAIGRALNLFWGLNRSEDAFALLHAGRDVIVDPEWRDEIDLAESVFQLFQARLEQARACFTELRARPGLGPRTAAQLPIAHAMALVHLGRPELARDMLQSAQQPLARWSDEIPWVAETGRLYRCCAALFAGRLGEAGELARAFHAHAEWTEWEFTLRLSCTVQAQVARLRGRASTAARWAREGRRLYGRLPGAPFRNYVLGELAHAEALAGDPAAAIAAVQEADDSRASSEALLQPWVELARSWVALATGDRARAVQLATRAAEYARDQQAAGFEMFALHDAVRLGAVRVGAGHAVVDRLRELAALVDGELVGVLAEHAAAAAAGDPMRLEAVGVAFAGFGADLLAAEAYAQAAHGYRRSGDPASDRRLQAQAALLLAGCEGARTPLIAGVEAPRLTARERDIARLAARGLSNQEIADRVVISSRTVGNHLHHVYAKLGISGRAALAALLPAADEPDRAGQPSPRCSSTADVR